MWGREDFFFKQEREGGERREGWGRGREKGVGCREKEWLLLLFFGRGTRGRGEKEGGSLRDGVWFFLLGGGVKGGFFWRGWRGTECVVVFL